MALTYSGQLAGKRVSTYEGKQRCQLQFMEQKGDGSVGFMEIRVPDEMSPDQFKVGQNISIPVEYKLVRDKVYWAISKEAHNTGAAKTV